MANFIGIDLGTAFSAVATLDETGRPKIVHNKEGSNITPSVVADTGSGAMEVGLFALKQWDLAPATGAARFKRDMGTDKKYAISGKEFTPTQLSALVLKKLVQGAEQTLGKINEAVVTIPANFAQEARDATMAAAKAAGLNVKFIVNEPTAAALYYAFRSTEQLNGLYAVYDFGGGTFDISIIRVAGQDVEVVATNGVAKLGGDDFDRALRTIVERKYKTQTGSELIYHDFSLLAAEEEKKTLSARPEANFRIGRTMVKVTRGEFEEAISGLVAQAEMLCEATLEEAKAKAADIRAVFLAGGSTRVPLVARSVEKVFQKPPTSTVNVDEVVALGAALYSAYKGDRELLTGIQRKSVERIVVSESTSKCYGTIAMSRGPDGRDLKKINDVLIEKGTKIPASITKQFYTIADSQTTVDLTVTESTNPETDPQFVRTIYNGSMDLPPGRPAGQTIRVTFAYDQNQMMQCSFVDVAAGREHKVDLSMTSSGKESVGSIDEILVE